MNRTSLTFATMLLITTGTIHAQVGDRGSGSVPMGSKGFEWQAEQNLAKEKEAEFREAIRALSDDEWHETALATLRFEFGEQGMILDEASRIGDVAADRKAVAEPGEYSRVDDPSWTLTFGRKAPRTLTLVLTDSSSTEVSCSFEELEEIESGHVGVFLQESHLVCFAR